MHFLWMNKSSAHVISCHVKLFKESLGSPRSWAESKAERKERERERENLSHLLPPSFHPSNTYPEGAIPRQSSSSPVIIKDGSTSNINKQLLPRRKYACIVG